MTSFLEKLTGKATAALQAQVAQLTQEKAELERLLAEAIEANHQWQTEVNRLTAEIEKAKQSADALASVKAFEITAAQGVPPVPTTPKQDRATGSVDVFAAYLEIQDPREAARFYAEHIAPKLAGGREATRK